MQFAISSQTGTKARAGADRELGPSRGTIIKLDIPPQKPLHLVGLQKRPLPSLHDNARGQLNTRVFPRLFLGSRTHEPQILQRAREQLRDREAMLQAHV